MIHILAVIGAISIVVYIVKAIDFHRRFRRIVREARDGNS